MLLEVWFVCEYSTSSESALEAWFVGEYSTSSESFRGVVCW